MTNEQKAREIADKLVNRLSALYGAIEMAEWKDQQMIEKFMKFLHAECYDARLLHRKDEIIRQKIEKAMKEE